MKHFINILSNLPVRGWEYCSYASSIKRVAMIRLLEKTERGCNSDSELSFIPCFRKLDTYIYFTLYPWAIEIIGIIYLQKILAHSHIRYFELWKGLRIIDITLFRKTLLYNNTKKYKTTSTTYVLVKLHSFMLSKSFWLINQTQKYPR